MPPGVCWLLSSLAGNSEQMNYLSLCLSFLVHEKVAIIALTLRVAMRLNKLHRSFQNTRAQQPVLLCLCLALCCVQLSACRVTQDRPAGRCPRDDTLRSGLSVGRVPRSMTFSFSFFLVLWTSCRSDVGLSQLWPRGPIPQSTVIGSGRSVVQAK